MPAVQAEGGPFRLSSILVITPRFPYPQIGGDRLRIFNICRGLARDHELTLVSLCETEQEMRQPVPADGIFTAVHRVLQPRWRSMWNVVKALPGRGPLQLAYYDSPDLAREVKRLAPGFDAVIGHLIRVVPYMRDLPQLRILEMTDAISMVYERARSSGTGISLLSMVYRLELERVRAFETALVADVDRIVLVSDADRLHLASRLTPVDAQKVLVCENGVHLEPLPFRHSPDGRSIIFIGNMQTLQNRDAALYFAGSVMPLVLARRADAVFRIIGKCPPRVAGELSRYRGVEVVGSVPRIADAAAGASVGVCPMRIGAGIQNKVLEYMAMGVPTVVSSMSARAFRGATGNEFLVADEPQGIADAVISVLASPDGMVSMARAARAYVEQNFDWERNLAPLRALLAGDH